jgi:microcompartment protein CcmK/EutM
VYTRPPYPELKYPYIIANIFDETSFRHVYGAKSVIIDSGVYSVFSRLSLKEYPGRYARWIHKAATWWYKVKTAVPDTYVTVPDYPADYPHNVVEDNVEKTIRNIEYAVKHFPNVKWIIPIQGLYNNILSLVKTFEYIADLGILDKYNYVAIANICTSKDPKFIHDSVAIIYKKIKQIEKKKETRIKIHVFGPSINTWKLISPYADSVDTVITNYWCLPILGKMCTKKEEKIKAWKMLLERIKQVDPSLVY